HPRAIPISAAIGQGLDALREAVIGALSTELAEAEIETDASNGRVLAYLGAHAEIYQQRYHDSQGTSRSFLPKHLLHHIHEPNVQVRLLDGKAHAQTQSRGADD